MTSRTHQIYIIIFEHGFDPPPVWTMLKKTALFLHDGFPNLAVFASSLNIYFCSSPIKFKLLKDRKKAKSQSKHNINQAACSLNKHNYLKSSLTNELS